MKVEDKLKSMYDDYYADGTVARKREITARQTVGHITALSNDLKRASVLDVGSGDGAVLVEMNARELGTSYCAVDISKSGVDQILARKIPRLKEALLFDGYKIPYPDNSFDFALGIHVIEHVEHERAFIHEILRVAKRVYVEVPLELTFRLKRAIEVSGPHGHINFYTPNSFRNLLATSGAKIEGFRVFPHDRELEVFLAGNAKGSVKYAMRTSALKAVPGFASNVFVYMCGAVISKSAD